MSLNRRKFLQLASFAGISATLPWAGSARASAEAVLHDGPIWLFFHAPGGWDATMLCDPKGRQSEVDEDPVNRSFHKDDRIQVGNFLVAPIQDAEGNYFVQDFFERHQSELCALNGVNTRSGNHLSGTYSMWQGDMNAGFPGIPAAIAALGAQTPPPLALLHMASRLRTQDLVPATRLGSRDPIQRLAEPWSTDLRDDYIESSRMFGSTVIENIERARTERVERLMNQTTIPRAQRDLLTLAEASQSASPLNRLLEFTPNEISNGRNGQIEIALAGLASGLAVCATLRTDTNHDSHNNHDVAQARAMERTLANVDHAINVADALGIRDRLNIVVSSEIGRRPYYNAGLGKDHYGINSWLLMGPNIQGNRVVGVTGDGFRDRPGLDPTTLQLGGEIKLNTGHVNRALRELAGIGNHASMERYALKEPLLPLFG